MTGGPYQPERGDFVWLDFTPHAGTEQGGRRPALVLSPRNYNIATGHCFVVPITTVTGKLSSFEVEVPRGAGVSGAIISNQLRDLDWTARNAAFHSKCDEDTLMQVLCRIEAILAIDCDG
ncbi:type II toxin-antitoxin system PemK/MazF family toxin [Brevundimonas diminuta]|uniref:type II toxin-antitoxin system PemK/MazF family toxin n=1 Tax=Brevundimonas diminuta TaxID=293 RepID=UPI003208B602